MNHFGAPKLCFAGLSTATTTRELSFDNPLNMFCGGIPLNVHLLFVLAALISYCAGSLAS
jgi:hypothetical protein